MHRDTHFTHLYLSCLVVKKRACETAPSIDNQSQKYTCFHATCVLSLVTGVAREACFYTSLALHWHSTGWGHVPGRWVYLGDLVSGDRASFVLSHDVQHRPVWTRLSDVTSHMTVASADLSSPRSSSLSDLDCLDKMSDVISCISWSLGRKHVFSVHLHWVIRHNQKIKKRQEKRFAELRDHPSW